jgi:hypothetical protein
MPAKNNACHGMGHFSIAIFECVECVEYIRIFVDWLHSLGTDELPQKSGVPVQMG